MKAKLFIAGMAALILSRVALASVVTQDFMVVDATVGDAVLTNLVRGAIRWPSNTAVTVSGDTNTTARRTMTVIAETSAFERFDRKMNYIDTGSDEQWVDLSILDGLQSADTSNRVVWSTGIGFKYTSAYLSNETCVLRISNCWLAADGNSMGHVEFALSKSNPARLDAMNLATYFSLRPGVPHVLISQPVGTNSMRSLVMNVTCTEGLRRSSDAKLFTGMATQQWPIYAATIDERGMIEWLRGMMSWPSNTTMALSGLQTNTAIGRTLTIVADSDSLDNFVRAMTDHDNASHDRRIKLAMQESDRLPATSSIIVWSEEVRFGERSAYLSNSTCVVDIPWISFVPDGRTILGHLNLVLLKTMRLETCFSLKLDEPHVLYSQSIEAGRVRSLIATVTDEVHGHRFCDAIIPLPRPGEAAHEGSRK